MLLIGLVITILPLCQAVRFYNSEQESRIKRMTWWDSTQPTLIDEHGEFISRNLYTESESRVRRDTHSQKIFSDTLRHYKLTLGNRDLHIQLKPNVQLYSPSLTIEHRKQGKITTNVIGDRQNCHYTGSVVGEPSSKVALAVCSGLTGVIMLKDAHYFIEPIQGAENHTSQSHVIYKAAHMEPDIRMEHAENSRDDEHCSSSQVGEREELGRDNSKSEKRNGRRKRSISREYFVETLVVVDNSMVEYYKNEDINTYLFTIMNMVSILFHDVSLGNSVNIVIVKLLLLDAEQEKAEGLTIIHHADKTLTSFCKWQKSINPPESDPTHHDAAILITRLDICSRMNEPCGTLGLSQVSGMCQPGRSCNVNQDTGLALAYTIAHEIGHNFGMKHDGFNDCSPPSGEKSYIMLPEFLVNAGRPLLWSNCSQQSITKFLDREWGFCLLDEPAEVYPYQYPDKPPGILYDVDHQCRLQNGPDSKHCEGMEKNLCSTLWCKVDDHCITRSEPAAEGTICEWTNNTDDSTAIALKWCFDGECVPMGERPASVDGGWAGWTTWTDCSRTCGGGVSISERHCSNPMPANGGKYCLGERKRYKICNIDDCPNGEPSFRQAQCTEFDEKPYKKVLYEWEPVSTNNPCQLNCKPKDQYFSVMLKDMVKNGTPCKPGTRNMCITGRCRKVGCDWKLDSNATEDRCGVCHGDGTTCKMVKDQYKGQQDLNSQGYVEATVIPSGARNIRIEEVAEANNYLAVRAEDGEYYLNGHWYIQWTGNYDVAGTTMHYERRGNKEGITAPGPIKEPLHIMLLFQSHNPGVVFEYTVPNANDTNENRREPEFSWQFLDWSHCTVSCGGGHQWSKVVCMEKEAGLVEDFYCRNISKPDDKARTCNANVCPARWWTGTWQHCSASCGDGGLRERTVLCVRSLGPEEQMALDDSECEGTEKPVQRSECSKRPPPCPSVWKVGPWSECKDACDMRIRTVQCTSTTDLSACTNEVKPVGLKPCSRVTKCGTWITGHWSECSKSCGGGVRHRTVVCIDGDLCAQSDQPEDIVACNSFVCQSASNDVNSLRSRHNRMYGPRGLQSAANDGSTNMKPQQEPRDENFFNKLWSYVVGHNQKVEVTTTTTAPVTKPSYNETWHSDKWGECSATCGEGQIRRRIWCPFADRCDPDSRPHHVERCTAQPCIAWVSGSWSQCSVTCGDGTQQRNVQCINLNTDTTENTCDVNNKPLSSRDCSMDKCNSVSAALNSWQNSGNCVKDHLPVETCTQLKGRNFCSFRYVAKNCCKICST